MNYSERWIQYFFDVAQRTAKLSYAKRLQVGAVAAKDKRIIACGFNGTPTGFSNDCETEFGLTDSCVIHAEENLILFSAKHGISLLGCDMFCTHSPCVHCSRMIISCGIKQFFYINDYRYDEGIVLLKTAGLKIEQFKL